MLNGLLWINLSKFNKSEVFYSLSSFNIQDRSQFLFHHIIIHHVAMTDVKFLEADHHKSELLVKTFSLIHSVHLQLQSRRTFFSYFINNIIDHKPAGALPLLRWQNINLIEFINTMSFQ